MNQGVIRSLKAYYKSFALEMLVVTINKGKYLSVFSIWDVMKMLDLAWQKVKTSIIVNCFVEEWILKDQQKSALPDGDDTLKDLQNQVKKLGDFYPLDTTAEDVISTEENLMITAPLLTNEALIEEVMNAENADDADDEENDDDDEDDDEDDDDVSDSLYPKVNDVWEALQVLHACILFNLCDEDIQQKLNALSMLPLK